MYIALSNGWFNNCYLINMFSSKRVLANILYSFTKILVKMEQLKFVETGCMSING